MGTPPEIAIILQADASDARLATVTGEVKRDLLKEADLDDAAETMEIVEGRRGGALSVGRGMLTFMTGGVAAAIVICLRTYLTRARSCGASDALQQECGWRPSRVSG